MSDKYQIVNIPLNQYDLHTILTALEFRSDMWESDIAESEDEVGENSRDKNLMKRLAEFKATE